MSAPDPGSISRITQLFRHGEIDPLDYLTDIETTMKQKEPGVNAFIPEAERYNRLRQEVESLRIKYPRPDHRPELYCLPIGVKDIFHVDGFPTCAGSNVPPNRLKGIEAKSVNILKKLGVLVFGKTVTTEFAYFAPGPTRNPHNLEHTPGGSSSGSAAAVAADMVPFAFGTQTIGSIIRPASYCGVVGFKPTYNRVSNEGVIPLAPSVDTVGFFTSDLTNAQYMAGLLCAAWRSNKTHKTKPVLGVPVGPYLAKANKEMQAHYEKTCNLLRETGYQIKKVDTMSDFIKIYDRHNVIVAVEAANIHKSWFVEFEECYHPKTINLIQRGQKIGQGEYLAALKGRNALRQELTELMGSEGIDLWLSPPAKGPAPYGVESTGDPVMNLPWTHCGFPSINIPAGVNEKKLPMGLQVSTGWYQDEALLYWGNGIERTISGSN